MPDERSFQVAEEDAGSNLDRVVAHACNVSRRIARQWIRTGRVRVNGKPVRVMQKPLRAGQRVSIQAEAKPTASESPSMPRIVLLESSFVVVEKPAGLLSETDRHGSPSLETAVPALLRARGETHHDLTLVHRLDAGTSGLIVLSRRPSMTRRLNQQFREGRVGKRYLALVSGRFDRSERVDAPIGRAKGTKHAVRDDGRGARTDLHGLAHTAQGSLVEAVLHTGRTHQIRVHASHVGHPLLGDRLYGGPGYTFETPPSPIPRPMLHAAELELELTGGVPRAFRCPPPADFVDLAGRLGIDHVRLRE